MNLKKEQENKPTTTTTLVKRIKQDHSHSEKENRKPRTPSRKKPKQSSGYPRNQINSHRHSSTVPKSIENHARSLIILNQVKMTERSLTEGYPKNHPRIYITTTNTR